MSDEAPPGVETGALRDKIVVPKAAVGSGPEGRFVWVVSDDVARKRAVRVGTDSGERIEVASGVNVGEKVVVRGAERLRGDTADVRVAE